MAKKKSYDAYLRQQIGDLIDQLKLSPLDKQALKERWLDQMIWADQKASECRRLYYWLRLTAVIGGVILPALVGISVQLGPENRFFQVWFPPLTFALSQVIAVSVAVEEFCKFGDRWRDYRKMAEDLKSEGWQYLQSSGPYEVSGEYEPDSAHERYFAQFTYRIESIIRNDVQSYITNLIQHQAQQEAENQRILSQAQAVSEKTDLIAKLAPASLPEYSSPAGLDRPGANPGGVPGYPTSGGYGGYPTAGIPPASYTPGWGNPTPGVAENPGTPAYPPQTLPPQATYPSTGNGLTELAQLRSVALAPAAAAALPTPVPAALGLAPPEAPTTDLNARILAAALKLRGLSTADGPDGGRNACAWTLNKVLNEAGIPPLGSNPHYVPSLVEALKAGRGQFIPPQEARAGDLVVACGEEHIGIGLEDGCQRVLSNSSSRAAFVWESDRNYQNSYGGASTIYRLLY